MKKFIVILFILFSFSYAFAADFKNMISEIELSVLGANYPNEKLLKRVERVERLVYQTVKKGDVNSRIVKLNKDLNIEVYKSISHDNDIVTSENEIIEDDSVDYPVLDKFEKHLAIKPKTKSLSQRLNNIEQSLYKKTFANDDFFTRVERIKKKIPVDEVDFYDNDTITYDFDKVKTDYTFDKTDVSDLYKLSAIERKILHKTYQNENEAKRLKRLENYLFETDFAEETVNERLARVESVLDAKKSIKNYDSNKFQQKLNTALQIGAMVLMVLAFIL